MITRTASCACGTLSLTATGDAPVTALCACLQCQKRTGSTYSAHAFYLEEAVEITGEHAVYSRTSDSGREVSFHFCTRCGSTVFWKAQARPEYWGVAAGAFADPAFPGPQSAIWMATKPSWAPIPAGIPVHPQGTPPAARRAD